MILDISRKKWEDMKQKRQPYMHTPGEYFIPLNKDEHYPRIHLYVMEGPVYVRVFAHVDFEKHASSGASNHIAIINLFR